MYAINGLNSSNSNHTAGPNSSTRLWCHRIRGFSPHMDYNRNPDNSPDPVASWSCGRN